MTNFEQSRIITPLAEDAIILTCVRCTGTGKLGPYALSTICPTCSGRAKVAVIVDGQRPLKPCLRCRATGKLGPYALSTPCQTCNALGCAPILGRLKIVSLEQLYAKVQHAQAVAVDAAEAATQATRAALPAPAPDDMTQVILVEAGALRDSHLEVTALFKGLKGNIRICDPYYGTGSLLRLDALVHCESIRFITLNADNKEKSYIGKALTEFTAQYPHVEFRQSCTPDLHDRYVLTDDEVIILGHGLKDVGKKESFVIRLAKNICGDLIDTLSQSFDARWNMATPLV